MEIEEQVTAWLAQQDTDIYVVGGTVRDRLLGRPVYDLDLAMAGDGLILARRLADRFRGAYYPLDEARKTGRAIMIGTSGHRLVVDVACFRGSEPSGSYSLEQSLAADLDDRDFTINALAADVRTLDDIVDRHGGLHDLAAGLIRPVSEGSIRNDPLRALRAVRLAAGLGFSLAAETVMLIRRDGAALDQVSGERVRDELARLLALPQAARYLAQLETLGLLSVIFPELEPLRGEAQSAPHHLDVLSHSLETVRALDALLGALSCDAGRETKKKGRKTIDSLQRDDRRRDEDDIRRLADTQSPMPNIHLAALAPFAGRLQAHMNQRLGEGRPRLVTLKLAALLHDTGKPSARTVDEDGRIRFIGHEAESVRITGNVLQRLRFNKAEVRLGGGIVRHHMRPLLLAEQETVSSRAVYRFFRDTGEAGPDVLLHALGDHAATYPPGSATESWFRLESLTVRMLADYYDRPEERVTPPLLIDGNDLMGEFELEPGPRIGELLEAVREAQVSGEVHTLEQALALVRSQLIGEP